MTGNSANQAPKDHALIPAALWQEVCKGVRYEKLPVLGSDGKPVGGLYNAWITLDNPSQFNSYTTDMVKGVILASRAASNARDVHRVEFTGAGDQGPVRGDIARAASAHPAPG